MALRYRLDNGLTVVFEEQHAAKVAAFQVWVKAGSADERLDQAGLAHLHEHMLFKGTTRRGPGEMAHAIEANGGEVNAWTSFDQTVYHVVMASAFAEEGLDILADAVRHPAFDAGELAREIEVVCEEIKRSQDTPGRRASRDLFATAFQKHPYLRPVIGWEETVRGFTREKVLEFYRRHYTPDNMVLSVCGDLTLERLKPWVEKGLGGDWGRTYAGPVVRAVEPPHPTRTFLLRPDDVKEVYFNLAFPAPAAEHPDTPALDVLAMIVGQGDASRLSMEVKRTRELVNDIHVYAYTPKDPGLFTLSMTLKAEKLTEAVPLATQILLSLREEPVGEDELATVKSLIESDAIYGRETVQGIARKLGFYESTPEGIEGEAKYYADVAALTPADLQAVARKYLLLDRVTVTALLPPELVVTEAEMNRLLDLAQSATPIAITPRKKRALGPAGITLTARTSGPSTSEIHLETLPSGATLIVREERAVPLYAVRAVYSGGLRYETEADNGLTALLCRMLTRGTPRYDAEEITHLNDDYAGSLSGAGGRNSVGMRGEFLTRHFDRSFDLFTECLQNPTFPAAELERERALVLQDIHTREDKPSGVAFDLLQKALFPTHPYRLPTLGEKASVEAITPDILRAHHQAYMNPSQLTLCVIGDVKTEDVVARARAAFGANRHPAKAAPQIAPEPPLADRRVVKKTLARAQSHYVLGFRGLRITDPARLPLEVLSTILSGQGGRLFIELRDKKSLAYSVSSFSVEGVDPGYFAVYMGTSPEKVEAARSGIQVELERIKQDRVLPAELERAQQHLLGVHEIGLQRNGARAAVLALDHAYGMGFENFMHYGDQIRAVTVDAVLATAQTLLDFDHSVEVVVGP